MGGLGMRELVIILLVVLVVFGAKKLRTVGSDLGHAVRGFKKAMSEGEEEQSTPPKQIPAAGADAEFQEVAKKSDAKTERGS
jgi:sec-independent protein translocase protein TatA